MLGVPEIEKKPAAAAFGLEMKNYIERVKGELVEEHGRLYSDLAEKREQELVEYEYKMNLKVWKAQLDVENLNRARKGLSPLTLEQLPEYEPPPQFSSSSTKSSTTSTKSGNSPNFRRVHIKKKE